MFKSTNEMVVVVLGFLCAAMTACGGGGGGGGGGSDSSHGVRVLHAAVDAAPVDVVSGGATVLSQQFFAGDKGYRALSGGPQVLSLTRTLDPADILATFSVDVTSAGRYSILLYGDLQNLGLRTRLIEDAVPEDITGALVRVVNGVAGAATLTVSVSPGEATQVGFGQNSDYLITQAGEVRVDARRTVDGSRAGSVVLSAEEGRAYTVLFAGEVGFYTKAVAFSDK